jgi:hypothetical protein
MEKKIRKKVEKLLLKHNGCDICIYTCKQPIIISVCGETFRGHSDCMHNKKNEIIKKNKKSLNDAQKVKNKWISDKEVYKAEVLIEVRERYAPFELFFAAGEIIEVIKGYNRFDTPAWEVVNHKEEEFCFDKSCLKIIGKKNISKEEVI